MADPNLKEVYLSSVDSEGLVWTSVVMGEMPDFVTTAPGPANDGYVQHRYGGNALVVQGRVSGVGGYTNID